jgi:hypothetical protein
VIVAAAALVLGFYLHFRWTPAFHDYLRTHPVDQARFEALQPRGDVLANADRWVTGTDPFEIAAGDEKPRQTAVFELELLRGSEVLLQLVQEFSIVMREAYGERLGAGVRTVQFTTGDDVRAEVRVYVHDLDELLTPGGGAVTFDVVLGAGEGPDHVAVAALPRGELSAEAPEHSAPSLPGIVRYLWPFVDLPAEGLLHRARAHVVHSFRLVPGGSESAGLGELEHSVNTAEYSYEARAIVKLAGVGGTGTRSILHRQSFSWNERIW